MPSPRLIKKAFLLHKNNSIKSLDNKAFTELYETFVAENLKSTFLIFDFEN